MDTVDFDSYIVAVAADVETYDNWPWLWPNVVRVELGRLNDEVDDDDSFCRAS